MASSKHLSLFKPLDIFVLVLVLLPLFFGWHSQNNNQAEKGVEVLSPQTNFWIPLNSDTDVVLHLKYDTYIIQIKDRKVSILETHCPLKICQKMGPISQPGQNIVCVPNRLLLRISYAAQGSNTRGFAVKTNRRREALDAIAR